MSGANIFHVLSLVMYVELAQKHKRAKPVPALSDNNPELLIYSSLRRQISLLVRADAPYPTPFLLYSWPPLLPIPVFTRVLKIALIRGHAPSIQ